MTVVAAVELDDRISASVGSDEAEHAHAGLSAGICKTDHLNRWDSLDHHLREDVF